MRNKLYPRVFKILPNAITAIAKRGITFGYCQVCERQTGFVLEQAWHREYYRCVRCFCSARMRSFMYVLECEFPDWRNAAIHESSPCGPVATRLAKACRQYTVSYFYEDVPLGSTCEGKRCENLESLTFADESFDLFVTQDVMEHVLNPEKAFREIARVLKPGGRHIFTVPWWAARKTETRVFIREGEVIHSKPAQFHGSPTDPRGCLVVTDWGDDMAERIEQVSGLKTRVVCPEDERLGIAGECLEVFISQK